MIDGLYRLMSSLGYEHPLHPPITHIPVGLVIGAFFFFLLAVIFRRQRLHLTARHIFVLALIFAFPTILLGVFDWIHFYGGALIPAIKVKMVLSAILLVLLGAGIILGDEAKPRRLVMAAIYALSLATVIGLGYFGGSLVFGKASLVAPAPSIGVAQGVASAEPEERGSQGKALFQENCESCHAGGGNIVVASLPLKGSKRLESLDSFERFVRAPTLPDGKPGPMPPFGKDSLDEGQVKALYDYVEDLYK